jgi:hypothetical protein
MKNSDIVHIPNAPIPHCPHYHRTQPLLSAIWGLSYLLPEGQCQEENSESDRTANPDIDGKNSIPLTLRNPSLYTHRITQRAFFVGQAAYTQDIPSVRVQLHTGSP